MFSTGYMHDVVPHLQMKAGLAIDLPATADATRGGFAIDTHPLPAGELVTGVSGILHGYWGFQAFDGPAFLLQNPYSVKWVLASEDVNALIVDRQDVFRLQSETAPCVDQVTMKDQHGKPLKVSRKLLKANQLEVEVPLKDESAGPVLTLVAQSGLSKPDEVPLQTYSEAAHLGHFALNAGDQQGVLTGTRLDEVAGLELNAIHFVPDGKDEPHLSASNAAAATALKASEKLGHRRVETPCDDLDRRPNLQDMQMKQLHTYHVRDPVNVERVNAPGLCLCHSWACFRIMAIQYKKRPHKKCP